MLEPIAEQLAAAAGARVTLTGTTADVGDAQGQVALSLATRAGGACQFLVDLGVPASSMTAVGLGSDFPGYRPGPQSRTAA